ncbi:hypothetical protein, conserved, partial [Plasmodium ovale curtisi]
MSEEKHSAFGLYYSPLGESIYSSLAHLKKENKDKMCSAMNSDICRTLSNYADYSTNKVKYVVNKRFSEMEHIEQNVEDIDYASFKYFRTLPHIIPNHCYSYPSPTIIYPY